MYRLQHERTVINIGQALLKMARTFSQQGFSDMFMRQQNAKNIKSKTTSSARICLMSLQLNLKCYA